MAIETRKKPTDQEIADTYQQVMDEVVRRLNTITTAGLANFWGLGDRTAEEFCCFHLRMVCELVAIGCLVAHGDAIEPLYNRFKPMYQADAILKALERLHPQFYPIAGQIQQPTHVNGTINIEDLESGFLTKQELIKLYAKCGDVLHIGSFDRWKLNWKRQPNIRQCNEWHKKFQALLGNHRISLIRKDYELWTSLNAINGRASSAIMKKKPAPSLV